MATRNWTASDSTERSARSRVCFAVGRGCRSGRLQRQAAWHFGGSQTNSVPVTMSMTDTPPAGVSVLSFQATLTGAALTPGNESLLAAPVTIDLTRLQTETSLVSSANVPPGTYTAVTLTFASPASLTIQNNSGGTLSDRDNQLLEWSGVHTGSRLDQRHGKHQPARRGRDAHRQYGGCAARGYQRGERAGQYASATGELDRKCHGVAADARSRACRLRRSRIWSGWSARRALARFTLQTALGNYNVTANTSTQFLNFPSGACTFTCIAAGQIVSVNMSLLSSNTLVASDIFFEDASTTLPEIEGVVVGTSSLPAQFSMVVLQETPAGSGVVVGSEVTVDLNATPFAVDDIVGSTGTAAYTFSASEMIVGQEVQVQEGAGSTSSVIKASRVLLRSSRDYRDGFEHRPSQFHREWIAAVSSKREPGDHADRGGHVRNVHAEWH